MDAVKNPYSPGAGNTPPELAGRAQVIENVLVAIQRISAGRSDQGAILVGLRGVGKTVLLKHISSLAANKGVICVEVEAPEGKSLPELLISELRSVLIKLDYLEGAKVKLTKAAGVLRNFIGGLKLKIEGIEISLPSGSMPTSAPGLADSGDLDKDLKDLFIAIGHAASEKNTAIALCIDELQYVPERELGSLISAYHACCQSNLPIAIIGAGLPQLKGLLGKAKSYSERLFAFYNIGPLDDDAATQALVLPARKEGVIFEDQAVTEILKQTKGYPYFLQEWGSKSWNSASQSPINLLDVTKATQLALLHLDVSFFAVRFDRCTPNERLYMRAMAACDSDIVRSGEIAEKLNKTPQQVGPPKNSLFKKGMIYSPAHGDTAFTVPLFADFMRRKIPNF
jgi:AAA ATPase domain